MTSFCKKKKCTRISLRLSRFEISLPFFQVPDFIFGGILASKKSQRE